MRSSRPFAVRAFAVCAITLAACDRPTAPEAMRMVDEITRDVALGGGVRLELPGFDHSASLLLRRLPKTSVVPIGIDARVDDYRAIVIEKVFEIDTGHIGPAPTPRRYILAWRGDTASTLAAQGDQITVAVGWRDPDIDPKAIEDRGIQDDGPSRSLAYFIPDQKLGLYRGASGRLRLGDQSGSRPCAFIHPELESRARIDLQYRPAHAVMCTEGEYDVMLDVKLDELVPVDSAQTLTRGFVLSRRSMRITWPSSSVRGYRFIVRCVGPRSAAAGCEVSPDRANRYFCEHPEQDPMRGRTAPDIPDRCEMVGLPRSRHADQIHEKYPRDHR
jgi:hypothetical protein